MSLRSYQQETVDKVLWAFTLPGNDLLSLPTGSGKSWVIAEVVRRLQVPVIIFQPTKEILEQNMTKLISVVGKDPVGVYSASMKTKEIRKFTFATIGSVYKKSEEFKGFKLVIIDEAHLLNQKSQGSMYIKFLKAIGSPKCIGLTATPYRLTPQYIRHNEYWVETITTIKLINRMKEKFWSRFIYNINVGDLIKQNYLCPLQYYIVPTITQEEMLLNKSKSDFDLDAFQEQINFMKDRIKKLLERCLEKFKSTLVFCATVDQAEELASWFVDSEVVTAKTKKKERERIISGFKDGSIKMVMNVGVLTTGFDHPSLDCIFLLRPTRSIGLYYQMVGRGLRKSEGKEYCVVVDMTDTVNKIGKVESIRVEKVGNVWELLTEKGSWHGKQLYSFDIIKE